MITKQSESEIITALYDVRENMDRVYKNLDFCSDELLCDSLNYELLALKARHKYFTQKAKELDLRKGLGVLHG